MEFRAAEVLISEKQIAERVDAIAAELSAKYKGKELVVIGILRGAVVFMTDLIRKVDPSVILKIGFMKASSYGASTETSGKVNITQGLDTPVKDKHVLIVEDIVDTGLTLQRLRDYFEAQEAASVEVCVLLDKKERRVVDVPVEYVGFVIPDEFVVGYGMDYAELMRNLPAIHVARSV
ncbi:MAG: hypoxanthine phosphoribosyltransferase [Pyramidobacter sp.]|nr:hypoxanthine phosphoribosyltransferase [Pyramidobacter sp.]